MLGLFLRNERDGDLEAADSLLHLATEPLKEPGQVVEKREIAGNDTQRCLLRSHLSRAKTRGRELLRDPAALSRSPLAPWVTAESGRGSQPECAAVRAGLTCRAGQGATRVALDGAPMLSSFELRGSMPIAISI